jgi:hypothetical protein
VPTAQRFTSVFPVLILLATEATGRDADRIADAISMSKETRSALGRVWLRGHSHWLIAAMVTVAS